MLRIDQQNAILRQIQWHCVLTLGTWILCPVRPVRPVLRRHIWLRLVRPENHVYTRFRPDTCNQGTLPPMHPDLDFNTIAHQD